LVFNKVVYLQCKIEIVMVSAGRRESIFIYWVISWVRFPPLFLPYFFLYL